MAASKRQQKGINGYGEKQQVRVITVDKERSRVECATRDGAMVYAAIWETPVAFRWPKAGEIWTIRKDSGIWRLDQEVRSELSELESEATSKTLNDLPEGHTRVTGETVHVNNLEVSGEIEGALAPGTVTTGMLGANGAWQIPTLVNSWAQYLSTEYGIASYRKDVTGKVNLRGLVARSVEGSPGTGIFVLPAGFRPSKHLIFTCVQDTTVSRVDVQSGGTVVFRGSSSTVGYLALDPISFWPD